ncbi:N-alpha-acetyltransferase 40 [Selaginella moellendorffii]|uniref:N-alpha-acetyltransferase 40 n=1 Tax=Selaginella moellendorffii TaxID=88036 RepID=UPI000D1CA893|nr:N-alpha-acetyltransferase 40 [Selaginella moellendorffii]|eukprot:XP_024526764.1 N-alpha-acetyltransferase 40 [Selaginella moellendorffii]
MDRSSSKKLSSKEKKLKRKEELDRKKAIDEVIRMAYAKEDHLSEFPAFLTYQRSGLNLIMQPQSGETLPAPLKRYIQALLKENMEGPYGSEWPAEEKVKKREMVASEARYIIVRQLVEDPGKHDGLWRDGGDPVVSFVQFRFLIDEEIPVLYVYELQLEKCVQKKGLGKFLMQLLELVARKNNMKAVLLTVQKRNLAAMAFYSKLKYVVSSISPSRVDPLIGAEKNYEILCKTFDPEAKAKLEDAS